MSTVIPVFNRPKMVVEAVESVLAQTYRPIEVIIVDDGSTDETPKIVRELSETNPDIVACTTIKNGGPGAAREAGRLMARGEFIQYLDSDDLLMPEKFALQVAAMRDNPACDAAYGKTRYYPLGDAPKDIPRKRTGERIQAMFPSFLMSRWWDTSTPLFRRTAIDRAGPWLNIANEEDWEYDCRIASQGITLCYCPNFVSDTRTHSGHHQSSATDIGIRRKFKARAEAHRHILNHARNAGIARDSPEMKHFARELFLLARQSGSVGLSKEAQMLFELARDASVQTRSHEIDFLIYNLMAKLLGWSMVGRLACGLDALRK